MQRKKEQRAADSNPFTGENQRYVLRESNGHYAVSLVDADSLSEGDRPLFHDHLDSKLHRIESGVIALARRDSAFWKPSEPVSTSSADWSPRNIFCHIRMPEGLDEILKARFKNKSAYVRFLIYSDLGLIEEAEREKARIGPHV